MKIVVFSSRRQGAEKIKPLERLAQMLGADEYSREDRVDCDLAIQWGWKGTNSTVHCVDNKIPILVLERAQFRPDKRKVVPKDPAMYEYFSVGYNGLAGLQYCPPPLDKPRYHPELKPWRVGGEDVVVVGQLPNDKALRGLELEPWIEAQTNSLRMHFPGHNVVTRPHPYMLHPYEAQNQPRIEKIAPKTSAFVAYTSNAATEFIFEGVPGFTCHKGNIAYPMTNHDVSHGLICPDRTQWARELSYRNWSIDELEDMFAWAWIGFPEARDQASIGWYDDGNWY